MVLLCQARFGNIAANNPTRDRPRSNRVREPSLLECSATTAAAYGHEMGTQLVFHSNTALGPSDRTCFNARSPAKQKSHVRDPNALDLGCHSPASRRSTTL